MKPLAQSGSQAAFTLIEIMLASIAAALILIAIYGLFSSAVKLRDKATARSHESLLRSRAMTVIRNDLENAYISGGVLASTLDGSSTGSGGGDGTYPGYLKLTTTTGRDTDDASFGDVEQVEYYVTNEKDDDSATGGTLVRSVTRDLLNGSQDGAHEDKLLKGVKSFQVSFYDGASWQGSWLVSGTTASTSGTTTTSGTNTETLPAAVRIDVQQNAANSATTVPPPIEILVPWTTAPFLSGTNFVIGATP